MSDEKIGFKEMCARFEVTPRTLRYYEYIELLAPEKVGRSRFYGPKELARMTLILRGRKWGFSLEEIRQWLLIRDQQGTQQQMQVMAEYAQRQITELRDQQAKLGESIQELEELHSQISAEIG